MKVKMQILDEEFFDKNWPEERKIIRDSHRDVSGDYDVSTDMSLV